MRGGGVQAGRGQHLQDAQGTREALGRQRVRSGGPVRKEDALKISPFRERLQRQRRIWRHCKSFVSRGPR